MNKRAISAIVATVLIILIVIAGIGILWGAILPLVRNNLDTQEFDVDLSIDTSQGYTFYDLENSIGCVQVSRGADEGSLSGVKVLFDVEGSSYSSVVPAPESNQRKTYCFNLTGYPSPRGASVAPVFSKGGSSEEGSVISEAEFKQGSVDPSSVELYEIGEEYEGDLVSVDCEEDSDCVASGCYENGVCSGGVCEFDEITSAVNGDGCCPSGMDASDDSDCPASCSDGLENGDETGMDCGGSCASGTESSCSDGLDNDGDCLVDCDDSDCEGEEVCEGQVIESEDFPIELDTPGETYILDSDLSYLSGTGITISADNVVLDCEGHTLYGSSSSERHAVNVEGTEEDFVEGVVIKNCNFDGWKIGIGSYNTRDLVIENCEFNAVSYAYQSYGIRVGEGGSLSVYDSVFRDYATSDSYGVYFGFGSYSGNQRVLGDIIGNDFFGCYKGLYVHGYNSLGVSSGANISFNNFYSSLGVVLTIHYLDSSWVEYNVAHNSSGNPPYAFYLDDFENSYFRYNEVKPDFDERSIRINYVPGSRIEDNIFCSDDGYSSYYCKSGAASGIIRDNTCSVTESCDGIPASVVCTDSCS